MTPDQITQLLDQLGQRLGPTGNHVFELAVRQQFITGVLELGLVILFCTGLLLAPRVWRWATADTDDDRVPAAVALAIVWFTAGIFALLALYDAVPRLLNPEYSAIADLLSRVTGTK